MSRSGFVFLFMDLRDKGNHQPDSSFLLSKVSPQLDHRCGRQCYLPASFGILLHKLMIIL